MSKRVFIHYKVDRTKTLALVGVIEYTATVPLLLMIDDQVFCLNYMYRYIYT